MTLGVSILYRKSHKQAPELFSFMHPLSLDVWIYMVFAYLIVSILLYILARYTHADYHSVLSYVVRSSPYEWENHYPGIDEEVLVNEFSLYNSLWFTIGSLMQQGSDIIPRYIIGNG